MKTITTSPFFAWLTVAALADWLITRTLARAAIFMPKSPVFVQIYQGMGTIGQIAANLTSVLALLALGWICWRDFKQQRYPALGVICSLLVLISLSALFVPSGGWLALGFQTLFIAGLFILLAQTLRRPLTMEKKLAVATTTLALLVGKLYQALPGAYTALGLAGPPPLSGVLFNTGEILVPLSIFTLWLGYGRGASRRVWLLAAIPALVFVAFHFFAPAMAGIMAIWSTGLTLYLPWPVYGVALWLAVVTVFEAKRTGQTAWLALLLLAAGGYAPQLSVHAFLGLLAVWVLSDEAERPGRRETAENTIPVSVLEMT